MAAHQHTTRSLAGQFRYRLIKQPGEQTRPITQKIRAAIFDTIGNDLTGLTMADLYAGSGALGIEALSRGAINATFVEKRPMAAKYILANLHELGVDGKVVQLDVMQWLGSTDEQYNIIFFDPPYAEFSGETAIDAAAHLKPNGVLIISCSSREQLPELLGVARQVKTRTYGQTKIGYYKR